MQHLITEQIRAQEQEFYQALVDERDIRIEDLRKTFHDKEYNYNVISDRLSHYEELEETLLSANNVHAEQTLLDKRENFVLAKLSAEKHRLLAAIRECRAELARLKEGDQRTKDLVRGHAGYGAVRTFLDRDGTMSEGDLTARKHGTLHDLRAAIQQPHSRRAEIPEDKVCCELRKLLKKEKVAYGLLKMSLGDSAEVGEAMAATHRKLLESRKSLNKKYEFFRRSIADLGRSLGHYMFMRRPVVPSPEGALQGDVPGLREEAAELDASAIQKQESSLLIKCGSEPTLERTREG